MNSLLTIAIIVNHHSRNLESLLKILNTLLTKLAPIYVIEVIIIYDNPTSNLINTIEEFSLNNPNMRAYKNLGNPGFMNSPMSSILENCNGDYIWLIEDNYLPLDDSLEKLCPILAHKNFSLLLLNVKGYENNKYVNYINTTCEIVSYESALSLFHDFGLTSITKLSSCFIFSKNDFSIDLYNEYSRAGQIHDLNFALLNMFHARACAFISSPILISLKNSKTECFFNFTDSSMSFLSAYIKEILKLTLILTNKSKFNSAVIFSFNEILISDDHNYSICNTYGSFILDLVLQQIRTWIKNPKDFTLELYHDIFEQFFLILDRTLLVPIENKQHYKKSKYYFIIAKYCSIKKIKTSLETLYASLTLCSNNLKQQSLVARQKVNYDTRKLQLPVPVVLYCDHINHIRLLKGQGHYTDNLNKQVLLSILIPSYNRGGNLDEALQSIAPLANFFKDELEIVVALNKCTDHSFSVASKHAKKFSFIKVITHDGFVQTAEENISRSISLCTGRYIWTLGDDDIVLPEAFILLIHLVEHNKNLPAILFNHAVTTKSANLFSKYTNSLSTSADNNFSWIKYQNLVTNYGLTTSMAFISRYIIHKDYFHEFTEYISISPIYSHVFFFLEAFYDQTVFWVNYPLITRYDSDVDERINTIASNLKINKFHLWSGGIIKLYLKLCEKTSINRNFFFNINETHRNHSYPLHIEVMQNIIRQYSLYINNQNCLPPSLDDVKLYQSLNQHAPIFEQAKLEYLIDKIIKLDLLINKQMNLDYLTIKTFNQEIEELTNINIYSMNGPGSMFQNLHRKNKYLENNIRIPIYQKIIYHYKNFGLFSTLKKILIFPYNYMRSR